MKEEIGKIIEKKRKQKRLSQRELSYLSGIPQTTISSVERGIKMPGIDTLYALSEALGITVDEILIKAGLMPDEKENKREAGFYELWGIMKQMPPQIREEVVKYAIFRAREAKK
jgi:transcriptional regulator with XRE-family HTH domain